MALGLLAGVVLQYSSSLRPGGGGGAQGTLRLFDAVLSGMAGQPFPQGSHQAALAAEVKQLITQAGHSGSPDSRLGGTQAVRGAALLPLAAVQATPTSLCATCSGAEGAAAPAEATPGPSWRSGPGGEPRAVRPSRCTGRGACRRRHSLDHACSAAAGRYRQRPRPGPAAVKPRSGRPQVCSGCCGHLEGAGPELAGAVVGAAAARAGRPPRRGKVAERG
jgi:hypothetical protein